MVLNYQNADCSFRKKSYCEIYCVIFTTLSFRVGNNSAMHFSDTYSNRDCSFTSFLNMGSTCILSSYTSATLLIQTIHMSIQNMLKTLGCELNASYDDCSALPVSIILRTYMSSCTETNFEDRTCSKWFCRLLPKTMHFKREFNLLII